VRVQLVDRVSTELLRLVQSEPVVESLNATVRVYGPKNGRPIVLAHGWTCSTEFWRAQINDLAGKHRVITYDQRGHGLSELGRTALSPDVLADDFSMVLAATLRPSERAVLVGHSMGGMTIMAWAQRHPHEVHKRAASAVLASTAAHSLLREQMVLPWPLRVTPVGAVLTGQVLSAQVPLALVPGNVLRFATMGTRPTAEQVAFCHSIVSKCSTRTRGRWGTVLGKLNIVDALHNLQVPTTVLVGTADRMTPPSHARRLVETLTRTGHLREFVEIPEVGHMSPVEAPEVLNAEIRRLAGAAAAQRRAG
jgi:pimeloyl-ACP methyl ester carboxylesterase